LIVPGFCDFDNVKVQQASCLSSYDLIIAAIPFEYIRPTKREVLAAAEHVAMKDATILAAARKARVDLLVTLDKKHLLGKPELTEISRVAIVTPEGAVEYLQKTN